MSAEGQKQFRACPELANRNVYKWTVVELKGYTERQRTGHTPTHLKNSLSCSANTNDKIFCIITTSHYYKAEYRVGNQSCRLSIKDIFNSCGADCTSGVHQCAHARPGTVHASEQISFSFAHTCTVHDHVSVESKQVTRHTELHNTTSYIQLDFSGSLGKSVKCRVCDIFWWYDCICIILQHCLCFSLAGAGLGK